MNKSNPRTVLKKKCFTQLYIEHDCILMHCNGLFKRLCYHILFRRTCKRMYFFL